MNSVLLENVQHNLSTVFQTAQLVRKSLLNSVVWKYTGSFSNYEMPELLKHLLRWIIAVPTTSIETEKRGCNIDQTVNNITQIVSQAVKTKRQIVYKSNSPNTKGFY